MMEKPGTALVARASGIGGTALTEDLGAAGLACPRARARQPLGRDIEGRPAIRPSTSCTGRFAGAGSGRSSLRHWIYLPGHRCRCAWPLTWPTRR